MTNHPRCECHSCTQVRAREAMGVLGGFQQGMLRDWRELRNFPTITASPPPEQPSTLTGYID